MYTVPPTFEQSFELTPTVVVFELSQSVPRVDIHYTDVMLDVPINCTHCIGTFQFPWSQKYNMDANYSYQSRIPFSVPP